MLTLDVYAFSRLKTISQPCTVASCKQLKSEGSVEHGLEKRNLRWPSKRVGHRPVLNTDRWTISLCSYCATHYRGVQDPFHPLPELISPPSLAIWEAGRSTADSPSGAWIVDQAGEGDGGCSRAAGFLYRNSSLGDPIGIYLLDTGKAG